MAKKTVKANEAVAFEIDDTFVTHAAEFVATKKEEIKMGDKFIHTIGLNRQVHEVVDIVGGPGAPGGTLVFLKISGNRPRIGDQLFMTVTPKILDSFFRKVTGRIISTADLPTKEQEEPKAE